VGLISGGPILVFLYVFNLFTNIESTFIVLGILLIISSLSILLVKEPLSISHINIVQNLKRMFKEKKDFKTYGFALFNSFSEGVILLFASLFILIQLGIVESQQTSLSLAGQQNENAFIYQSYFSLTVSGGIILGSIAMGYVADLISRKFGVYFGMIFLAFSVFLLFITKNIIGLFIIAFIIGVGVGFRHSAYSPIASQMAKSHPEFDSTYFSFCNSLSNLGSAMGLILAGVLFNVSGSYMIVFIIIAIAQLINLIPFSRIETQFYEVK
jgi:MFS family permease